MSPQTQTVGSTQESAPSPPTGWGWAGGIAVLSRELGRIRDPVQAVWRLVCVLREELPLDRAGIFAFEPRTRTLHHLAGVDRKGEPEFVVRSFPLTNALSPLQAVARRDIPHYFSQNAPADYPDHQFAPGLRALAVLPILACDQLVGILSADNCLSGRPIPEDLLDPLHLYAGLASLPLFAHYQSREQARLDLARMEMQREILLSVSGGKILLCDRNQIDAEWKPLEAGIPIREMRDVAAVREAVRRHATEHGFPPDRADDLALCASEAATNALVHAREGEIWIRSWHNRLQVMVRDRGEGITVHDLPRATLVSGWSSRASLGLGFTLMKETADRVQIHTGPEGTTVVMEIDAPPPHWTQETRVRAHNEV